MAYELAARGWPRPRAGHKTEEMERQQDYVLRSVEERGVRLIRLWFTDVLGQLKSFAISPAELENALEEGMTIDGSSIDGFSRVQESDVLALPDPNSFELLPWVDPHAPEARMFCDIANLDGAPFEGDPRQVLRRTDALTMADSVMTFRLVVREAAAAEGVYATFMPKPLEGVQGSGMHTHVSLFEGEENAFHDPGDPYKLSKSAKGFIAGLLRH